MRRRGVVNSEEINLNITEVKGQWLIAILRFNKIGFGNATYRAAPIIGQIIKCSTGRNTTIRIAFSGIINITTNDATVLFHRVWKTIYYLDHKDKKILVVIINILIYAVLLIKKTALVWSGFLYQFRNLLLNFDIYRNNPVISARS
jgi:hypothetical protein